MFYRITVNEGPAVLRQAGRLEVATARAAAEFAGRPFVVEPMSPALLDAWAVEGHRLPAAARPLVAAWRLQHQARQARRRAVRLKRERAREGAIKLREEAKAQRDAARAAARAEAQKAQKAAKRVALKEAWRVDKAAAVARGEPLADDYTQKAWMQARRSRDSGARKLQRHGAEAAVASEHDEELLLIDEDAPW